MSGVWRVTVTPRWCWVSISMANWFSMTSMFGCLCTAFDQAVLNFCSRIIFMVKNTELGVSAFAVQVKFAFLVLSKSTPHLISSSICAGASRTTFLLRHGHWSSRRQSSCLQCVCRNYPPAGWWRTPPSLCEVRIGFFQPTLQIRATLPLCATLSAKLIPAIPEPITRKSNFLTIILFISPQSYKISHFVVLFVVTNS